jgi:hypothetical protein
LHALRSNGRRIVASRTASPRLRLAAHCTAVPRLTKLLPLATICENRSVIPEDRYPNLATEAGARASAIVMATLVAGAVKPLTDQALLVMILWLSRLVDGALLDYQAARIAYFEYNTNPALGGALPVSAAIVAMLHHIENCVSNMERVREMVIAIRNRPAIAEISLGINKNDWKIAEAHEHAITGLRNAIQHAHNDLRDGKIAQGGIEHHENGTVSLGPHILSLGHLATALRAYWRISKAAAIALRKPK